MGGGVKVWCGERAASGRVASSRPCHVVQRAISAAMFMASGEAALCRLATLQIVYPINIMVHSQMANSLAFRLDRTLSTNLHALSLKRSSLSSVQPS